MPLVRSYRTLAPLPVRPADRGPQVAIGGVFLWHCPHGRPHRALPGRPGHRGARTFLNRPEHHRGWSQATLHRSRSPRLLSRIHVKQPTAGRCRPVEAGCWRGASLAIGWGIWGC